jgi:hypothetical protein
MNDMEREILKFNSDVDVPTATVSPDPEFASMNLRQHWGR